MKLYRSILLNEGDKINTEKLGCSWSLCEIFAENHAKDINGFHGKQGFVVLSVDISEDLIDMDNTLFAMQHRPHEFEVVINGDICANVHYVEGIDFDENQTFKGNTGSESFEDYCDDYEGDLTKEDFLNLASEI